MAIIPSNSVDPKSVPGGTGKLVLLLGGIAFVVAAVLVVAGVFYFSRTQAADPAVDTPQSTPTTLIATPTVGLVVESAPTEAPQVVMIVTSPTPTVTPTNPPVVTETAGSSEVVRSPTATRAPTSTPTSTPRPFRPTPTATAGVTVDGWIEPITPDENFYLPADGLTFQWKWHDNKACQSPPDGYGFEIRIWRDVSTDFPKGAMNARDEKPNISCDPESGLYTFTIGNVKKVPGVQNAEFGRFRWDIAIVQLDPYAPVITSPSRIFYY
ncbi:MAG TPA: hypothetical protein P5526_14685 [Anaerolineae bacterium]|nr:hypothetical protein [Anaerolineae bacterium]